MRVQTQRGFTLLEIAIVLAIISILAGLSFAALQAIRSRASFAEVSVDTAMAVRRTRAEAFGRGVPTAFVIDTVGKRWWGIEAPTGVNLDTFDPAAPGRVIVSGTLPEQVSFGPTGGFGKDLDAPLAGIPMTTADGATAAYCSFCRTSGTNPGFGTIVFSPSGPATFSAGDRTKPGQQFTLTGTADKVTRTLAIAIVTRTGAVEAFEK